ncbi:MAG: MBL fold metallo-hydrolase [Marinosulfonomonas sp.]|nr:MBL fold metallo-hydrolase [Marinosulfonomonas sp.]
MHTNRPETLITLEPGLRRVLAPNPSHMTYWGTNSYILGEGRVAVLDPGPADPTHLDALLGALKPGETVSHILVTHSHRDHSPLSRALAEATGAPVYAFGDSQAGRSDVMKRLVTEGLGDSSEGIDYEFSPDEILADGDVVSGQDWALEAIWTPGHLSNHLCFVWDDAVFSGDHVMGWAPSMVSPPDGDLTAFMASTERLAKRRDRVFYSGHGDPIADPAARTQWLLDHRRKREKAIMVALSQGHQTLAALTSVVYADTPKNMHPAASRSLFAHLIDLIEQSRVTAEPNISAAADFRLI